MTTRYELQTGGFEACEPDGMIYIVPNNKESVSKQGRKQRPKSEVFL